jgi:outer membrane protein, multidrug efflux system
MRLRMRYLSCTLILGLAALLSLGCGGLPGRPQLVTPRTSIPAPETWAATESAASPPGPVDGEWWRSFDAPELEALVASALEQSYSLETASARIETALVQARLAGAALTPQMDFALLRNRQRQNFVGLPIPGSTNGVLSNTFTLADLGVSVAWELDLWGRVRAGRFAAEADAEASFEDLRAARQSLAAQVARQWFAAAAVQQQIALSERTLANYRFVLEAVQLRYREGLRPPLDVRLTLTEVSAAEARYREQLTQRDAALRQLQALAGSYPDGRLQPPSGLPTMPPPPPVGLPASMVARRPDLIAAERRLAASGARVTEARAARYPAFALTSGGGYNSNQLTDVVSGNFLNYNLIGNLTAPLLDGNRRRNQTALREAQVNEALANFRQSLLDAYREVETALAAERLLAEQQQIIQQNVQEAVAARDLSIEQYRAGLIDVLTLLNAERSALAAEANLIEIQRQRLTTRVDLHLALGGGFESGLPRQPDIHSDGSEMVPSAASTRDTRSTATADRQGETR